MNTMEMENSNKPPVPPKPLYQQKKSDETKKSPKGQNGKSKETTIKLITVQKSKHRHADENGTNGQACCFPLSLNAFKSKAQEMTKNPHKPPPKPPKPSAEALARARKNVEEFRKKKETDILENFKYKNGIDDIIYADADGTESSTGYKDDDVSSIAMMELPACDQSPLECKENNIRDSKTSDITIVTNISDTNSPDSVSSYHTAEPGSSALDSLEESSVLLAGEWDLTSSGTPRCLSDSEKTITPSPQIIHQTKLKSKIDSLPQSLNEKMQYFYEKLIVNEIEESVVDIFERHILTDELPPKPPRTRESPVFIMPLTELPKDLFPNSPRLERKSYPSSKSPDNQFEEKSSQTMLTSIVKNPYLDNMPNVYQTLIIKPRLPPPRPPPPNLTKVSPPVSTTSGNLRKQPPRRPPRKRSKTVEVIYPSARSQRRRSLSLTDIERPDNKDYVIDLKSLYTSVNKKNRNKDANGDSVQTRPLPPPPPPPRCRSRSSSSKPPRPDTGSGHPESLKPPSSPTSGNVDDTEVGGFPNQPETTPDIESSHARSFPLAPFPKPYSKPPMPDPIVVSEDVEGTEVLQRVENELLDNNIATKDSEDVKDESCVLPKEDPSDQAVDTMAEVANNLNPTEVSDDLVNNDSDSCPIVVSMPVNSYPNEYALDKQNNNDAVDILSEGDVDKPLLIVDPDQSPAGQISQSLLMEEEMALESTSSTSNMEETKAFTLASLAEKALLENKPDFIEEDFERIDMASIEESSENPLIENTFQKVDIMVDPSIHDNSLENSATDNISKINDALEFEESTNLKADFQEEIEQCIEKAEKQDTTLDNQTSSNSPNTEQDSIIEIELSLETKKGQETSEPLKECLQNTDSIASSNNNQPEQPIKQLDENANVSVCPKSKSSSPELNVVRRSLSVKRVSRSIFYDDEVVEAPSAPSLHSKSSSPSRSPKSWCSESDISCGELADVDSMSGSLKNPKPVKYRHKTSNVKSAATQERRSSEFYCEVEDNDSPIDVTKSREESPSKEASDSPSVTTSSYSEVSISSEESEEEPTTQLTPEEKKQRKLFFIAREIMTSEEKFVDVLKLLNVDFRNAVDRANKNANILPEDILNSILSYLPQLQGLNENLLLEFKDRIQNWKDHPKISDVIVKIGPFLKLYSSYIKDFDSLTYTFDEATKKYPLFRNLVTEFEQTSRCQKLALKHFMLKPIQRIPQYRLLLQQYLNNLEESSPDYVDTIAALEVVSNVADHANDIMKQGDNFQKMLSIQNRISGHPEIVKPGREFLKEGELFKLSRKGEQPRLFILFNDQLLYLTPYQGLYKVNHNIPLAGMKVHVPVQHENEFCIISRSRSIQLMARSQAEQEEWVSALNKAIEDNASKRSTFMKRQATKDEGAGLGMEAPVWVPDARVTMCQVCTSEFSLAFRRHHCRACGKVICSLCSTNRAQLPYRGDEMCRVCDECFPKVSPDPSSHPASSKFFKRPSVLREVCANDQGSTISGYLYRYESRRGSWKRYWFVLKDKVLYTYKASEDVAALQSMPVLGFSVKIFTESFLGVEPRLLFQICQAAIVYTFYTTSAESAARWVKALGEAAILE